MAWVEPHHGKVLTSQLELQQDQAFTDLTLVLKDGEVRACRCTVASLSRVFHRMLATNMREQNEGVLTLKLVSMEDWYCILSFYLSGNKLVTADNVEDVLAIAHLYELEDLEKHCGRVLVDTLTSENCCYRLVLSKTYVLCVTWTVMDFIKKNFGVVRLSRQFTSLPKENVLDLLRIEELVATEESLCDAVLHWLEAQDSDEETTLELLSLVKLEELSTQYICKDLIHHGKVAENVSMQKAIAEEMSERSGCLEPCLHPDACFRLPKGVTMDIVVLGHDVTNRCRLLNYQRRENEWVECPAVDARDLCMAQRVGNSIFLTGGVVAAAETHVMHIASKTWSPGPDLVQGRHDHGMAAVGDSVFVVGGWGGEYLTSIEKHVVGSDGWCKVGDLQIAASTSAVATIGDVIVVAGGWESPDLIQTFNIKTRTAVCLDTRLPVPLNKAQGASLASGAIFVGKEGDLVHVSLSDNGLTVTRRGSLPGFGTRNVCGMTVEGRHFFCLGGGVGQLTTTRVDRYSLHGKHANIYGFPELPVALRVHGAFLVSSPL